MAYEVSLTAPAESDLYAAFERIREATPLHAEAWLTRFFAHLQTLEEGPQRCPLIPEAEEIGLAARHLLFGKGRVVYRIIFRIHEEKRQVQVLRVWHGSRQTISADDIGDL